MEQFKVLVAEVNNAALEADKFYIDENMQAGKRFFASLMEIERKCKIAREELSEKRKIIRERRQQRNEKEKMHYLS